MNKDSKIYTETELNELCQGFQKLLRLQDWEIHVQLVDQLSIPGDEASVTHKLSLKEATINIPTPETFASSLSANQDMRHLLLHEMIHLYFSGFQLDDLSGVGHELFELAINSIAGALATLIDRADGESKKRDQSIFDQMEKDIAEVSQTYRKEQTENAIEGGVEAYGKNFDVEYHRAYFAELPIERVIEYGEHLWRVANKIKASNSNAEASE